MGYEMRAVGQKRKKKHHYEFLTNYRREIKFIPINLDDCLLLFDAAKFFLRGRLHGGFQPNFNFFNVNPQIF